MGSVMSAFPESGRSQIVGFLLRRPHQVDAARFARLPFVQLGDDLLHRSRHGLELPVSAAANGVGALNAIT